MSEELEIAAADGLGELSNARGHAPKHGARCPNCDAVLKGAYCHACGQSADDHRRSFGHLCIEMVEDLFHLDGRLARTLPDLFLRPGRLAHDYIERKLARHVPPFRLFLVSLLVFMVIAEHEVQQATKALEGTSAVQKVALATQEGRLHASETMRAEAAAEKDQALKDAQNQLQRALAEKNSTPADAQAEYSQAVASANSEYQTVLAASEVILKGGAAPSVDFTKAGEATSGQAWMEWKRRFKRAVDDPELFLMSMFELGHRLAVLLLPVLGFTLALAFRSRPRLFVYDHMHRRDASSVVPVPIVFRRDDAADAGERLGNRPGAAVAVGQPIPDSSGRIWSRCRCSHHQDVRSRYGHYGRRARVTTAVVVPDGVRAVAEFELF